jgi:hypothetical protein
MESERMLRFFIDERWTINELSSFIDTLQYFNDVLLFKNDFRYSEPYNYDDDYNPLFFWLNKYIDKDILVYDNRYPRGIRRIKTFSDSPYGYETRLKRKHSLNPVLFLRKMVFFYQSFS